MRDGPVEISQVFCLAASFGAHVLNLGSIKSPGSACFKIREHKIAGKRKF